MIHKKLPVTGFSVPLLVLLLLTPGLTQGQSLGWDSFTPEDFVERVLVKAYGKEFIYYGVDAETPLTFAVKGPTQVRILTRLRYTEGMSGEQSYTLRVLTDGTEREKIVHRTTPSKKAAYIERSNLKLGKAMKLDVVIDDTNHTTFHVRLSSSSKMRVEARIYKLDESIELIPTDYAETVTAFLSESRERSYSLLTHRNPVQVRVEGPVHLRVQARLNYSPGMIGKQMYSIKVLKDGQTLKTFHIESVRSSTVTYKDRPDIIPGALHAFEIEVPEGQHVFDFQLPDSQSHGVALRFLVPSEDLW
jgi:hypothetical protein